MEETAVEIADSGGLSKDKHVENFQSTVQGRKWHSCVVCDFSSYCLGALKRHELVYSVEKPYKCNDCDYVCLRKVDLKAHFAVHSLDKPYKCNICDYSCKKIENSKSHKMVHSEEKPYKCNVCNYACNHKYSLKVHVLTHGGEKTQKCNVCDYACYGYSNLNAHKCIHSEDKSFKCNDCNYAFKRVDKFKRLSTVEVASPGEILTKSNFEIIEFPCIWADSSFNAISVFHRYVKPIQNPVLTPFCTELTGITQAMVENEETFDMILPSFLKWLQDTENDKGRNTTKTFVICGDWDLEVMFPDQCRMSNVSIPPVMTQWLNLKKVFLDTTNYYPKSLKDMCRYLGISSSGREHSGIGDCRTILNVMKTLKMKYMQ